MDTEHRESIQCKIPVQAAASELKRPIKKLDLGVLLMSC